MRRCAHECVCWAMVEYGDAECPGLCDAYAPMVDVDALLALADGLDKDADNIISAARNAQFTCSGPRMEEAKHDAYEWRQIASRIREALGVQDGD